MEQQNTLRDQIAKEEHRNIYLSQLLKNLQEKLTKIKNNKDKEITLENRADLEIAQMKNLDKRIDIYKHQLEKLKSINTTNVVGELRKLREEIMAKEKQLDEAKTQLYTLHDVVNKMRVQNMGKDKNKEMEKMYGERKYEMKILHKRLKALENQEYSQSFKSPPKKSARSFTQLLKEKEATQVGKIQEEKKGKIDQFAMYKNLIRFYTLEQAKLKTEIESLSKEVVENKKVHQNIQSYQQKIASIQKK